MKRSILIPLLVGLSASFGLSGCDSRPYGTEVTARVRDRKAYALGEEHAAALLRKAGDEAAVQDELLEIRARIYNFSTTVSPQSGADYERGFTDYVTAHSDSLARILF